MLRNKQQRGAKLVVIDPRKTATAEEADLFLAVAPGMDQALFAGLLVHLAGSARSIEDFIRSHTTGFEETLASARRLAPSIAATAAMTGLRETDRRRLLRNVRGDAACRHLLFAGRQSVGAGNRQGQRDHQLPSGDRPHRQAGRFALFADRPAQRHGRSRGRRPRQPARGAYGLSSRKTSIACAASGMRRAWPTREGHKAVQMFEAVARGEIKALWVIGTNPAASLPDADMARAALKNLELFVVSDNVRSNDTIDAGAHMLLPGPGLGRKGWRGDQFRAAHFAPAGLSAGARRSARRLGHFRAVGQAPGLCADSTFARRRRVSRTCRAVGLRERRRARLRSWRPRRIFRTTNTTRLRRRNGRSAPASGRVARGCLRTATSSRRIGARVSSRQKPPALKTRHLRAYPLRLNTGRVRDQWHTMTRTGLEPAPRAAFAGALRRDQRRGRRDQFGLTDGGFATVSTLWGACVLRVIVTDRQPRGQIFAPIHWTDATSSQRADRRAGRRRSPTRSPVSRKPRRRPRRSLLARFASQSFLLARNRTRFPSEAWWTRAAIAGGYGYQDRQQCDDSHLARVCENIRSRATTRRICRRGARGFSRGGLSTAIGSNSCCSSARSSSRAGTRR